VTEKALIVEENPAESTQQSDQANGSDKKTVSIDSKKSTNES
jgi:hypothetical protein